MKIIFLAYNPTALRGILYVIDHLMKEMEFIPVLVCNGCYYETDDFEVINTEEKSFIDMPLGTQKQDLSTWYNKKDSRIFYQIKQYFEIKKYMSLLDIKAKKIYEAIKPDFFIVTDDRVGGMHMALLKYAKKGTVIRVPVAVQADYNVSFYSREYNSALVVDDRIFNINHLQCRLGDKMIHTIEEKSRAFYQTGEAFAFHSLGMLADHPWASGASKCDYVLTVSQVEKERVLEEAYPRRIKVEVMGLPEDYDIVNCAKNDIDIHGKYKDLGNKVVVFAIPQMAEHNEVSWKVHRPNIRKLSTWINAKYGKVLFSLHPKSRKDDYVFLESEGLGYICEEKLSDIIRYADVLICSEASSVKEWATLLGIKRYLTSDDALRTSITDCNKVFIKETYQKDIYYREKEDVKEVSKELLKAIQYLEKMDSDG